MSLRTCSEAAAALSALVGGLPGSPRDALVEGWGAERWLEVTEAALVHDLGPILHQRVESAGLPCDEACRARLRGSRVGCLLDNSRILEQSGTLAAALAARGVGVIALKGVHLAATAYPDPGYRPMRDIDLLVAEAALDQARSVLHELGYRPSGGDGERDPRTPHLPHFHRPGSACVEVHHSLLPPQGPFAIDLEGVRNRAVPFPCGTATVAGLCPEDLLLHLCLHAAARHCFRLPLRALYDIHQVLVRPPGVPNVDVLVERAAAWKARRAAYWSLVLTNSFFGTPLPDGLLAGLGEGTSGGLPIDALRACILDPTNRLPRSLELVIEAKGWKETLWQLRGHLRIPIAPAGPLRLKTFSTNALDEPYGRKRVLMDLVLRFPQVRARIARSRAVASFGLSRSDPE